MALKGDDQVKIKTLDEAVKMGDLPKDWEVPHTAYKCEGCKTTFFTESPEDGLSCFNCGKKKFKTLKGKEDFARPTHILPFLLPRKEAVGAILKYLDGFWYAETIPRILKAEDLRAVYIPIWVFEVISRSSWKVSRGEGEDASVVNGYFETKIENIEINASEAYKKTYMELNLWPDDLKKFVPYVQEHLDSFEAEVDNRTPVKIFVDADDYVDKELSKDLKEDKIPAVIGGDLGDVDIFTSKECKSYKHVLIPVWVWLFKYRGKTYRFSVNGRTARVGGKKPLSYLRVGLLIGIIVLLLILGVIYMRFG
ncbi:MAG: hypothetical protein AAGC85_10620 [Bacteroidota bacterium]